MGNVKGNSQVTRDATIKGKNSNSTHLRGHCNLENGERRMQQHTAHFQLVKTLITDRTESEQSLLASLISTLHLLPLLIVLTLLFLFSSFSFSVSFSLFPSSSFFRRVHKIPKSDYELRHICPSVRMEELGCPCTDFSET
jgi:hypothetical protein